MDVTASVGAAMRRSAVANGIHLGRAGVTSAGISGFLAGGLTTESNFTGSPDSKRARRSSLRSGSARRCRSETWSSSRPRTAQTRWAEGRGRRYDSLAQLGPAVVWLRRPARRQPREDGRSVLLALQIPGDIADADPKIEKVIEARRCRPHRATRCW